MGSVSGAGIQRRCTGAPSLGLEAGQGGRWADSPVVGWAQGVTGPKERPQPGSPAPVVPFHRVGLSGPEGAFEEQLVQPPAACP